MLGTPSDSGILLRAARDILAFRESTQGDRDISVYASYIEVYNEQINDLMEPGSTNLRLREDPTEGFYASGVKMVKCTELDDFRRLIKLGEKSRHYNKTDIHEHSSRSHTILRIAIENRMAESRRIVASDDEQLHLSFATKYSILQLVDLAGSERLAESGSNAIEETSSINKSLFVLAQVISKLSENQVAHVPYRSSKLTSLLRPALGGNSLCSIICTVSPSQDHVNMSISTMRFGQRAQRVKVSVT